MSNAKSGVSYAEPVRHAKQMGFVMVNQYDGSPSALRYRKAVYRAVKRGLLKREKSPPSRAVYRLAEQEATS